MSMISELVDRLRKESKSMGTYGTDYMATLLMRSADTIEMLSKKAREPNCSEKPNNCANCKHLKKHNGKLADYVCDRKGSIVTNPYDKECDEMWEPKTEPNVSEIPTGSESQTEVDWKKRLCDMYGADRKSFDEAWEKYEADKVNTEPQTETSTFSEKVQLTEVTQTERSSE